METKIQKDLVDWLASASEEDLVRFSKLYHAVDDKSDIERLAPLIEGEMLLDCEDGFAMPIRDNYQNIVGAIVVVIKDGDVIYSIRNYN